MAEKCRGMECSTSDYFRKLQCQEAKDLIAVDEARKAISDHLTTFENNLRDGMRYFEEVGAEELWRLLLYSIKQDLSLRFGPFCEYLCSSLYLETIGRSAADAFRIRRQKLLRNCVASV